MRVKVKVVVAEGRRRALMRVKAEVVVAEVEGEPLESISVNEGESKVVIAEAEMTSTGQDLFISSARLVAPL